MADGNPRAGIGGNNPPPYDQEVLDALDAKVNEFIAAAGEWADLGEIETEEQAGDLNDFLTGLKKNRAAVEAARKAAKKPHDEAVEAVQTAYVPLVKRIDLTADKLNQMLTEWMRKKDAEQKAAAAKARMEAERAQKAAEEAAAKAAARNDFAGEAAAAEARKAAEEQAKEAERMAKAKAQVASGSGGGRTASYRTYWKASITNPRVAAMQFLDNPKMIELLVALAEAKARTKDFNPEEHTIPGFEFEAERRAV